MSDTRKVQVLPNGDGLHDSSTVDSPQHQQHAVPVRTVDDEDGQLAQNDTPLTENSSNTNNNNDSSNQHLSPTNNINPVLSTSSLANSSASELDATFEDEEDVHLSEGPLFAGKPSDRLNRSTTHAKHRYTPSNSRSSVPKLSTSPTVPQTSSSASSSTTTSPSKLSLQSTIEECQADLREYCESITCYDLMANNVKIVIFDTELKVKKAFFALVQHRIRSAPLWCSGRQQFVGMLTVTDFIKILLQYYTPGEPMRELEEQRIQEWRDLKNTRPETLLCIDPMCTLHEAIGVLLGERIHRLPVIDCETGNATSILTHKRILHFLYFNRLRASNLEALQLTLRAIKIGTFNVTAIRPTTQLVDALQYFATLRVSALPVVDENNTVIDIYAKHDVFNLARERTYDQLSQSVQDALLYRQQDFEGVQTCTLDSTIQETVAQIVTANVHRLVIVDRAKKLVGVISLSDILKFLLGFS